jgi:putative ATPase
MIAGGEDPRFIARRMVILASEDIGLADSNALGVAVAAANAVELVGLPEAQLNLAHAAVYLALAPKSNAVVRGIGAATEALERRGAGDVPAHLRGTGYPGAGALGHGVGYKYPHDFKGAKIEQRYMPEGFEGDRYWEPEDRIKGEQ